MLDIFFGSLLTHPCLDSSDFRHQCSPALVMIVAASIKMAGVLRGDIMSTAAAYALENRQRFGFGVHYELALFRAGELRVDECLRQFCETTDGGQML